MAGKPTKIGILGGSVTKGHGLMRNNLENWTIKYLEAWKRLFPKSETTLINGAVPATGSDYYSMCFGEHIDEDVDLVIVELMINDQRYADNRPFSNTSTYPDISLGSSQMHMPLNG